MLHPLFTVISTTFAPWARFKLALTSFPFNEIPEMAWPFSFKTIWLAAEALATLNFTTCEELAVVETSVDGVLSVIVASLHLEME